ncbi:putative nucleotidyltransferase substrate binding domain-containing protein [Methyloversatilis thermotolerans]|uniref:putative nucleotidyltransferase substrate binding domain-containing protein n=1 Tax=Methyloversatilis thermotolerans TaxID=1346290 RepID=UPI00036771B3|nr:putative nucleotidyltransferase substrate binding domain-containing protein [Methyloversatilis thermotolerans]
MPMDDGADKRVLRRALAAQRVFSQLDPAAREALLDGTQIVVLDGDATIDGEALYMVIDGRISLVHTEQACTAKLGPGDLFGHGTPATVPDPWSVRADRATLARIGAADIDAACASQPVLQAFLTLRGSGPPPRGNDPLLNLMTTPVRALARRAPVTVAPGTPVRDAARLMAEHRVSSALLVKDGQLVGVVTDRDLRSRVIAQGVDTGRPVIDVASTAPITMDLRKPAFEALLLMARHNIHHVPLMDGSTVAGMVSATDLSPQHSTSAVYLAGDIYRQQDVAGLIEAASRVRSLQQALAAAGASAYSTGHIITAITDAITRRLLQLAEARFGAPPVDYVWVAAGSQARSEQTAKSDQDNCLVLDDAYDEARHGEYFRQFATWVCDGLDACGYVHCPGDMMAMTDQWRQPRTRWLNYFDRWTAQPEPKALMLTCVFFDLRAIGGRSELLDALRAEVLARTRGNRLFLAHMVGNALTHTPPLGLFRSLSVQRSGEHKGTLDLKHGGIVPVVDLARVYALAGGHEAVNTHDRLAIAADSGEISAQSARDLSDALEFIATLRIRHQARQIAQGVGADNHVSPDELSNFERSQLKDAFSVVQTLQSVLGQRYQGLRR